MAEFRRIELQRQAIEGPADSYTIVNLGPDILYYGDPQVSPISNTGSLSTGASVSVTPTTWVVSAGRSQIVVSTPSSGSSGGGGGGGSSSSSERLVPLGQNQLATPVPEAGYQFDTLAPAISSNPAGYNGLAGCALLPNGKSVIAIWRQAAGHQGTAGNLMVSYHPDAKDPTKTWSTPVVLLNGGALPGGGRDLRDAAITVKKLAPNIGRVILNYTASAADSTSRLHSQSLIWSDSFTINDAGIPANITWTGHREDYTFDTATGLARSVVAPQEAADGSLLWAIYTREGASIKSSTRIARSATGALEPSNWTIVSSVLTDESTVAYTEPWLQGRFADGTFLLSMRDDVASVIRFALVSADGATITMRTPTVSGTGRTDMLILPDDSVLAFTRRMTGERPVMFRSRDKGVSVWDWVTGSSSTEGRTTDGRNKDDGSPIRMLYGQSLLYTDGDILRVDGAETGPASGSSAGSSVTSRWILNKAGLTPHGTYAGDFRAASGALWIVSATGGVAHEHIVEADGRYGVKLASGGLPFQDRESGIYYMNVLRAEWCVLTAGVVTLTNIPSAVTLIDGTETFFDFQAMKEYLLICDVSAGAANAGTLKLQYTVDSTGATGWTDINTTGLSLTSAALRRWPNTLTSSIPDWNSLPTALKNALGTCRVRAVTSGGNGTAGATIRQCRLLLRAQP